MSGVITSIPPIIQQPPGNASSNPAGLPGVTYTPAIPTLPQTWTGLQTFQPGSMQFAGSVSGHTFLNASPIASGIADLPALTGTDTLLANNNTATVTNKSLDGLVNTFTNLPAASLIGTLPALSLPNPSATTLGGIESAAAVSHQWINSISTSGVPALSQPAFTDISGSVAATQLPNPSATTLGGIESLAAVASKWINTISTSGAPSATQPAFTDVSGSVAAGQMPALTGDVTTIAGAVATTIAANAVTNAKMAQGGAFTLKGNATGSTANLTDVDVTALTVKASPVAADIVLIHDSAASFAFKKATVGTLASAGSVSSIAGNTGAFTLSTGITNVGNDIRFNPSAAATISVVKSQVFTTSGTYTPSAGIQYAIIECVGGGGAGGSITGPGASAAEASPGGGAGGYSRSIASAATIGASQVVTIGAAGAPGAAGNNSGGSGGVTSLGAICVANGGVGAGFGGVSLGGSGGGIGTGNVISVQGMNGETGKYFHVAAVLPFSGTGGSSVYGVGGIPALGNGSTVAGNTGAGNGSGGSGAGSQGVATTAAGGAGTKGIVIITEFCNQ